MSRIWSRPALLGLALVFLTGCSSEPKRYKVSGVVKYKDKVIPNGQIAFIAEGGTAPAGGAAIKDGAYEIAAAQGLLPGKYKVSISYPDPKGAPPEPKEGDAPGVGGGREVRELLPEKYNGATELTAEVKPDGSNEFPFDLK